MKLFQKEWSYREIICVVIIACSAMIFVESVLQPPYAVKSAIKLVFFLGSVFLYAWACECKIVLSSYNGKALKRIVILAFGVYLFILGGYFLIQNYLDTEQIRQSLMGKEGIDGNNFIFVAVYISVVNSFVEELFFRGLAFRELHQRGQVALAYIFSAASFAIYHIGIISGWFSYPVFILIIVGLFAAGIILNLFCRYADSILGSWAVHVSANLAINTIGFMIL